MTPKQYLPILFSSRFSRIFKKLFSCLIDDDALLFVIICQPHRCTEHYCFHSEHFDMPDRFSPHPHSLSSSRLRAREFWTLVYSSCVSIVSHLFLSVIDSGRFANNCKVSARTNRNVVADDLVAQIFRIFLFQSETVVFSVLVPLFQTDYEVDILLRSTRSTEQRFSTSTIPIPRSSISAL